MQRFLVILTVLVLGGVGTPGEEPPTSCLAGQRLRFVIPHGAGGGYDVFFRLLTPTLAEHLQATIVTENRDGAGGLEGATLIKDSPPDGKTLGCLNGAGLLSAYLSGDTLAPHPLHDFTLLARATRSRHVWYVAAESPLRSIEDVIARGRTKPVVFGARDVASSSFISLVVGGSLLRIPHEFVTGFSGSREGIMAVLRGDVDLTSANFDSIENQLRNGELRALLQISSEPIADSPLLNDVPLLGGPAGWAARTAESDGGDPGSAITQAAALDQLIGSGRLIVGPPGLSPELRQCMETAVEQSLADPQFRASAAQGGFAVEAARGQAALEELAAAEQAWEAFKPLIREAIRKVRK